MPEWIAEERVDEARARALIGSQFPELGGAPLRLLGEGWDSTVWLVDGRWAFRFPRRQVVVPSLERQAAILPALAPLVPLAIPVPVFQGRPSGDYPWPFVGAALVPGREAAEVRPSDEARAAAAIPLARFLRVLHGPRARGLPGVDALPVDPVQRGDMGFRVPRTTAVLAEADQLGLWHAPHWVEDLFERALALPAPRGRVLAHGDLHLRHLLLGADGPTGVIDWVDVCLADPAIDLVLVWSFLPASARTPFAREYGGVPEDAQLRSRVLSLFLSATLAVYARREGLPGLEREAVAALDRTVT